jgi:hypothetical protein
MLGVTALLAESPFIISDPFTDGVMLPGCAEVPVDPDPFSTSNGVACVPLYALGNRLAYFALPVAVKVCDALVVGLAQ